MEAADAGVVKKGQELIGRLYQLIEAYEEQPQALNAEQFMDLYARVERAVELSGESESQAFNLDQALFNAISLGDVDQSDLRFIVCHALSIHHRYHADYGRGFEQAYKWCAQSRAQQLPDLRYVHTYMLPAVVKSGAMGGNPDVCLFLLERLGRFENLEKSPVWDDDHAHDLLQQEPADVLYQLARRKVMYIAENLTKVPNSLEQILHKDGAFKQLFKESQDKLPLLAHALELYGYTRKDPWYRRLGAAFAGMFRGMVERMAGEYLAYELTKRKGAYIVQTLLIGLILLGLAMVMFGWAYYSSQVRLTQIESDLRIADELMQDDVGVFKIEADMLREKMEGQ